MTETVTAKIDGVELFLCNKNLQPGEAELWQSWGSWDGPNDPAPISVWPQRIKDWRIAKQMEASFQVWNLKDEKPKYWEKRPAVFREGSSDNKIYGKPLKVLTRNNKFDPESLYGIEYQHCAMDTPEVESAIETARKLHAEAVEALHRFKDAVKAIPRMSKDDWAKLPTKPGNE